MFLSVTELISIALLLLLFVGGKIYRQSQWINSLERQSKRDNLKYEERIKKLVNELNKLKENK
ncbi:MULTISPECIES: hypothetical protein [Citrobacter]|uniref:hypothetical protein n=1 Tax=Citrobacter TaxID=544 RepID=UPI001901DBDC|nr:MULTISPECIES: hypothetical protein [Citrobacter]MBJ9134398.1 hypothetical protein [Citrobacter farmeri]MDM2738415.1 hypothetical protein [Citrobacter sp. Ct235]